ncbi:uncharacterized protein LOC113280568 [Papaver somniferum]|uniref:uncharacterized protein LOC113280568 n=1 Tax=Papaver somniferum TaxID=3469 RepID=UPI000E6F9DCB|nr:uncharacterized protein LOC113280568 [Papaver somniferum]
MLNIISWNVKTAKSLKRRSRIKTWVSLNKPDILILQETLLPCCTDSIVKQIWGSDSMEWRALDSMGRSGGILIIWNPNKVSIVDFIIGTFSINIHFVNNSDNFHWLLSGVYGPRDTNERKRLWKELTIMKAIWCLPWVVAGDFNTVLFMAERKGCTRRDRGMKDFGKFCDHHELIDIPIAGAKYTWTSSSTSSNPHLSKLDRFLVLSDWEDHFLTINVTALARPFSDHKPIILSCSYEDWGHLHSAVKLCGSWNLLSCLS